MKTGFAMLVCSTWIMCTMPAVAQCTRLPDVSLLIYTERATLRLISSPVNLQSGLRTACRKAKCGMPFTQLSLQVTGLVDLCIGPKTECEIS